MIRLASKFLGVILRYQIKALITMQYWYIFFDAKQGDIGINQRHKNPFSKECTRKFRQSLPGFFTHRKVCQPLEQIAQLQDGV
jgi:hypothetical protein